jgi:hypothetical protein
MQVAAAATKQVNELTIFIFVSSFPFKTFALGKHFNQSYQLFYLHKSIFGYHPYTSNTVHPKTF